MLSIEDHIFLNPQRHVAAMDQRFVRLNSVLDLVLLVLRSGSRGFAHKTLRLNVTLSIRSTVMQRFGQSFDKASQFSEFIDAAVCTAVCAAV